MFRRFIAFFAAAAAVVMMICGLASCAKKTDDDGKYTVGICQLAPHVALDSATQGFKDALTEALGQDNVEFLYSNATGESAVCATIINDFVSKKVDLIMANATAALQAAANGTTTIPILGTSITEYGTALGLKDFNGTVGGNISGTSDLAPLSGQADMVVELFPEAKTVGLLYCSAEANSAYQVKEVTRFLTEKGLTCKDFAFSDSNDVASVAAAAAADCDVIYVPTDNTAASCTSTILGAIGDTPAICGEENACAGCGVAALSIDYYDLGVATGKMAAKILKGEANVSEMAIEYAPEFTKKYNAARCAELGIDTAALEAKGYVAIAAN